MNQLAIDTLKIGRKIHTLLFKSSQPSALGYENDPAVISTMIQRLLTQDRPCMIARFGGFELGVIVNYLGVKVGKRSITKYIKGEIPQWWWNEKLIGSMNNNAGFFPPTKELIERFCQLMIEDSKEVDILGSWQKNECHLSHELRQAQKIQLMYLDPYWSAQPWSRALEGKKVLVVHPFAESIQAQYEKRELLFKNTETLPTLQSLQVIKAVQSIGGEAPNFKNWFEALESMKTEIDQCDYDICLIGCGAYGFPLAAHVKRSGKKSVHMGGSLQLLFGIMGNRWDHDVPHHENGTFIHYAGLENEHWVRPHKNERPHSHQSVEGSCYW